MVSRREAIEEQLRRLEQEYEQLKRFPEVDVFENGTIIAWVVRGVDDKPYSFAATRAVGVWYFTGYEGRRGPRDYDSLLTLIGDGTNVRVIDPDVGVELDELVIELDDAGVPWRNRTKEARNVISEDLITCSPRASVPIGTAARDELLRIADGDGTAGSVARHVYDE